MKNSNNDNDNDTQQQHLTSRFTSVGCGVGSALGVGTGVRTWIHGLRRLMLSPWAVDDDESETESESEVEDEREINAWVDDNGDSWVRFAAGFRPSRVCTRFLEHQMRRPVWEVRLWR